MVSGYEFVSLISLCNSIGIVLITFISHLNVLNVLNTYRMKSELLIHSAKQLNLIMTTNTAEHDIKPSLKSIS